MHLFIVYTALTRMVLQPENIHTKQAEEIKQGKSTNGSYITTGVHTHSSI